MQNWLIFGHGDFVKNRNFVTKKTLSRIEIWDKNRNFVTKKTKIFPRIEIWTKIEIKTKINTEKTAKEKSIC